MSNPIRLRKYIEFLFVFLIIAILTTDISANQTSFEVEIAFKQVSHQNPWLIKEPIRKSSKAVQISNTEFFAITLPNEIPLHGEIVWDNRPNFKLNIKKYDKSTGFIILESQTILTTSPTIIEVRNLNKICGHKNIQYINFSFSQVPIRAVKINRTVDNGENYIQFSGNKLCGFVMGSYLISTEYIDHFIRSTSSSPIPHPGFEFESVLNSSERSFYFPGNRKGIIVTKVYPGVGPNFQLMPGDAIFEINGVPLSKFPDSILGDSALDAILRSNNLIRKINSPTKLKFIRNGTEKEILYKLDSFNDEKFLVPETHPFGRPPYLIMGGLFFTELTSSYLKEFGENYRAKSEKKLLYIAESFQSKTHPHRQRLVILSRPLLHPSNQGYQSFQDLILNRVNGVHVLHLKHLKEILELNQREFISFDFSGGRTIVFRKEELEQINSDILKTYNLNSLDNLGE
ncbi:MAG: hypothetical protein JJT78_16795 [Leptospira sp.]|nr:hypothetical protein [Leptospira sp.]